MSSAGPSTAPEISRFKTLCQLLASLNRAETLEEIYEAAIASLVSATAADRAAILLFEPDGVMRFRAWRDLSREYRLAVTGHTPWPRGARDAQPVVVPDVLSDPTLRPYRELMVREGIRALAFIPLALERGVFGKFMLYFPEVYECSGEELALAQVIAGHVALGSERKRTELEFAKSGTQMRAILDNSPDMIFVKDLQGRYTLVNRGHDDVFGMSPREVIGKNDYELFPAEIAERLRENDRDVLTSRTSLSIEEVIPHKDGMRTYLSTKFPIEDPDGSVVAVCGFATDITDRKRLEFASSYLASIVENSDDAVVGQDLDGAITAWNRGAERVLGYTAAEALGQPIGMLAAPDSCDEMPGILEKIRRGACVDNYETRRRRKDGQIIDVSLTVSPVRNAAGQVIGASRIARDITERKRAEQEFTALLEREQETRKTAELLNRVGPRLAAELDLQKLVQAVTDIATTLVGAEIGSFFHKVVNEQGESYSLYTHSGAPREAFARFPMVLKSGAAGAPFHNAGVVRCDDITQESGYEERVLAGDKPVRSYLAMPVISRSGEVLGGLFFGHAQPGRFTGQHEAIVTGLAAQAAIAMDNARLFEQAQRVQNELKRSNDELRRANQDLETFAYSASHDLQEPLRNISISAQLLELYLGDKLEGDCAEFMSGIVRGTTRMKTLIDDLLAYSLATRFADGPPPEVESTEVLDNVLESLRDLIQQAGATITHGSLPVVYAHEGRLAQVFQNLISNALKYRNKKEPYVRVSARIEDGWCLFSVEDNGIGIEARHAEQIFGLFKRLHSRDEYPGSGIGLAICQRIVEQYGGRIWLERSSPGDGSTFCFSLRAGGGAD